MTLSSLFHRKFYADVERNVVIGRRFGDDHTFYCWLGVLTEELGKLARVANKLNIAEDADVRAQWSKEGYHRLLTLCAVSRRMAENWPEIVQHKGA
jgi:hypothetical protein